MAPSDLNAIYAMNHESKTVFFSMVFVKEPIKSPEELLDKLKHDTRLAWKYLGHFYLCIPKWLDKCNGYSQNKALTFEFNVQGKLLALCLCNLRN